MDPRRCNPYNLNEVARMNRERQKPKSRNVTYNPISAAQAYLNDSRSTWTGWSHRKLSCKLAEAEARAEAAEQTLAQERIAELELQLKVREGTR